MSHTPSSYPFTCIYTLYVPYVQMRLAETRADAAVKLQDALEALRTEHTTELQKKDDEWRVLLDNKDRDWVAEIRRVQKICDEAIAKEKALCDVQIEEMKRLLQSDMEVALAKAAQQAEVNKLNAIAETDKKWSNKMKAMEVDLDFKHSNEIMILKKENEVELQRAAAETALYIQQLDKRKEEKFAEEMGDMKFDMTQAFEKEKEKLLEEEGKRVMKIQEEYRTLISDIKQQHIEETERRIRELRDIWNEELTVKLGQQANELETVCQQRLLALVKETENDRISSVKLEAA